jgi:hypothetical protein
MNALSRLAGYLGVVALIGLACLTQIRPTLFVGTGIRGFGPAPLDAGLVVSASLGLIFLRLCYVAVAGETRRVRIVCFIVIGVTLLGVLAEVIGIPMFQKPMIT